MISNHIKRLAAQAMRDIAPQLEAIDETAQENTEKVLAAYQSHKVTEACFAPSTGYGYDDKGRETLNKIFADIMGTPSAVVSTGFVSGTHAITCALFAALRPGEVMLSATGLPYDTLHGVIGIAGGHSGSLRDYGIGYKQVELSNYGRPDIEAIAAHVADPGLNIGAVFVQRSRGYASRRALSISDIGEICKCVRDINKKTGKDIKVVVDNCYGEFVEASEPGGVGADLVAGSLIKNPGGGLAPKGGYIAGRECLARAAAHRLTAPGVGHHAGASPDGHRLLYQGLFMAPHTVAQALKTAVFAARLFEMMGFETSPAYDSPRSDIIQEIRLKSPELLERFCKGIQAAAPVDSFVTPVGGEMPGYDCDVIMAAGTFIQGASIELSADAPMREPFNVFLQGALTFESGRRSVMLAAEYMISPQSL